MHLMHWMECNTITFCSFSLCFLSLVPAAEEKFEKDSKIPERTLLREKKSLFFSTRWSQQALHLLPACLRLFQSTEQVTAFCRSLHDMNSLECPMSSSSSSSSSSLSPSPVSALPPTPGPAAQRQLSHADKLRKVINELVETERTYVKVSSSSKRRLEPESHQYQCAVLSGLSSSDLCLPVYRSQTGKCLLWRRSDLVCAFRTWAV